MDEVDVVLDDEPVMRQCTRCDRLLMLTEDFRRDRRRPDGYGSWCKECQSKDAATWRKANPGRSAEAHAAWYKANTERHRETSAARYRANTEQVRAASLKKNYGLTVEAWNDILHKQNNLCALCHEPFNKDKGYRDQHTDHDHVTGTVRGILHSICNTSLGVYERDKSKHEMFENYLKGKAA